MIDGLHDLQDLRSASAGRSVARVLILVLEGNVVLSQGGCDIRAKPDDLLLFDDREPFTSWSSAGSLLAAAHVDCARLGAVSDAAAGRVPYHLDGRAPLGVLVASIVRNVLSVQNAVEERALRCLNAAVLDMLTMLTPPDSRSLNTGLGQSQLLNDITQYMRAHIADDQLDPGVVAEAFRIAPRTLRRLFAADGTTFMRSLWHIRLSSAHEGLESGRFDSVTEAALVCGFSSPAHFSRSFKMAFGYAPIDLKRKRII